MKIIFLDIDGVLNSHRSFMAKVGQPVAIPQADWSMKRMAEVQAKQLDPVAVALLNRLTDADPTIKLVISSTHRLFAYRDGKLQLNLLRDYMRILGVTGEVIDATPRLEPDLTRGQEIDAWLSISCPLAVKRFIIIDDDADMLPTQMNRFVQTDAEIGFSIKDVKLVQGLLNISDAQLFKDE